jgi:uncharacterized iron-regulated membrane protein
MAESTGQANAATISPKRSWRQWHGLIGLLSAPFVLITAICGGLLLLRKIGLYERQGPFRNMIQRLHSYELLLPYVGLIAAVLMILAAATGLALYSQVHRRR